jgi:hypothetical protein
MATQFIFNGKTVKIPNSYATTKSGVKNPSITSDASSCLVIDTGSGSGYGFRAGFNGTLENGEESFYKFDNILDFNSAIGGGLWSLLSSPLFRPAGLGVQGISELTYIRALNTSPAELSYTFTGDNDGSDSVVNGGTFTIQVRHEGLVGNGTQSSGVLKTGFGAKMFKSLVNTNQFFIRFYRGSFTGLDQNGLPFNGIKLVDAQPIVLIDSPAFDNIEDLIEWMSSDFNFNENFKLKTSSVVGDGSVDLADYNSNDDLVLFAGGTESFSQTVLDNLLVQLKDYNVAFVLADKYGANAMGVENFKLAEYVNDNRYQPELYVAGGSVESQFETQSIATAEFFNNQNVTVVHGGVRLASRFGNGFKEYDSIYKACAILGREAGLPPQVPLSFKNINIDGERHILNDRLITRALDKGVVVTRNEGGSFDIIKGVNSVQNNQFLVNEDGTTHSKQIRRIYRQLNKLILINSRAQLLKRPNGSNRANLSPQDVTVWLSNFLSTQIATDFEDNLILSFQDITITREQDGYFVRFATEPNSEINFLFFFNTIIGV